MNALCVIQARMGSKRLPGKVLAPVDGRPLLTFMLDRLTSLGVSSLVVATSDEAADDPVAEVATAAGVATVRGPELDVLARFGLALDAHPADVVIRLTADCPLVDPALVSETVALLHDRGADYASNSLIRTFPDGLDVEVFTASALRDAIERAADPIEREHVTPYIYRRTRTYGLVALRTDELLGDERWTVDTATDLDRVRAIVAALDAPATAGWREVLRVAGRQAGPAPGELALRPATAADGLVDERDLSDPASRTWVAEVDRRRVGWLRVRVDDGEGELTGEVPTVHESAALVALDRALAADYQVTRLTRGRISA